MMNNDEQVDLACQGFRKAVENWCRRYTNFVKDGNPSLPEDVDFLLQHVAHCVRQLNRKRQSLQNGLSVVRKTLWPQVLEQFRRDSTSTKRAAELLKHFLGQCLRLHDGVLLLISGECRHKGDINTARKTKFKSHLLKQTHRPDGYTKLYQAPGGYSGFGFDEYNDPEAGIHNRLMNSLSRYSKKRKSVERISEYLVEHGGQALDSWWEQHESQMTAIHEEFVTMRDQVVRELKQTISSKKGTATTKVAFVLHDKMEKLQVGNIVLERRADDFQLSDPKGALPIGYTGKDWEKVMALSGPQTKQQQAPSLSSHSEGTQRRAKEATKGQKRRRVIEDSSSEDEDKAGTAIPTKKNDKVAKHISKAKPAAQQQAPVNSPGNGLSVKIKYETKPQTPGEGKSYSLTSIKTRMGADVEGLKRAREELEREEAVASKAARADEIEDEGTAASVERAEKEARKSRRVLERVLSRAEPDENEIWDARETLRKDLMDTGNQILQRHWSSQDEERPKNDRHESLKRAYEYFRKAGKLVKEQETFHRALLSRGESSSSPEESRYLLRNLVLLLGQAQANMGITRVEQATLSCRKKNYNTIDSKRYLRDAIQDLIAATECAEALRTQVLLDKKKGSDAIETFLDSLRAHTLDALATRWKVAAIWHQGLRQEAANLFDHSSSLFQNCMQASKDKTFDDDSVQEEQLKLGSECYYACTMLAELASSCMDELPHSGAVQLGNELLSYVKQGLTKASTISDNIQEFIRNHPSDRVSCEDFLEDYQVMTSVKITQSLMDLEQWWEGRKIVANRPIPVDPILLGKRPSASFRSELVPGGLEKMPTRRFVVSEGATRRHKHRRGRPNPMYNKNSGNLLSSKPVSADSPDKNPFDDSQPMKFRPWGDELLPQTIDELSGQSVPVIAYPSIAPPMPPEVIALLNSQDI